jgi:Asp-tRNA(Asn)/Glu-tRNA(Gln) amidotransferase A subunit family amidase
VPTVQRLLDAGIIMHARSTTSEFAHTGHGHSPLWGTTHNPWNLEMSPGGSSAGGGASVASGMTTIADGTDGGGSVRIPASCCGVFGYKPPFGRNPVNLIATNWEPILHFGPITRSVADGALMQNVMSGFSVDDITTLRDKVTLPLKYPSIKGWRIAYSIDLGYFEVDHEVRKATTEAVEVFRRELGCTVDEVKLGWTYAAYDAWCTHWEGLFSAIAGQYLPRFQYEMDPVVVRLLTKGAGHSAARVRAIEFVAKEMYKTLGPILEATIVSTLFLLWLSQRLAIGGEYAFIVLGGILVIVMMLAPEGVLTSVLDCGMRWRRLAAAVAPRPGGK